MKPKIMDAGFFIVSLSLIFALGLTGVLLIPIIGTACVVRLCDIRWNGSML